MSKPTPLLNRASVAFGLLTIAMLAAVVVGMIVGGSANPTKLADAGDLVRWGLPLAKSITNLGTAVAIGSLAFAAFALSSKTQQLAQAMNLAAFGAGLWTIFGALSFLFTYLSVTGSAFSTSDVFGQGLWLFATDIELGRYLALNLLAGAVLTVLALAFQSLTSALLLAALGLLGLVPIALTGHSAGVANHALAVNSIGMHLVAVTIWVGGLVALVSVRDADPERQANLVKRYSTLALIAFVIVAVSGISVALLGIGSIDKIFTPYGFLVLMKSAALLLLGAIGGHYRTSEDEEGVVHLERLVLAVVGKDGDVVGFQHVQEFVLDFTTEALSLLTTTTEQLVELVDEDDVRLIPVLDQRTQGLRQRIA